MKRKTDAVHELVMSVMSVEVPAEGQLVNPFKPKRKSSKQTSLDEMLNRRTPSELPDDVNIWTNKNFATFFARNFQNYFGGNYKITFVSDLPIIKQIQDFFKNNGLDSNEWTKKFIEWSFENNEIIIKRYNYFTLNTVLNSINYFYQDEILSKVESGEVVRIENDYSLLKEIDDLQGKISSTEIFARFGIPITVTYLCNIKKYSYAKVMSALMKRFENSQSSSDIQILERIFNSSIINSPYPDSFLCLDWRDLMKEQINFYKTETWWRDSDYKGKYLNKYESLLGG